MMDEGTEDTMRGMADQLETLATQSSPSMSDTTNTLGLSGASALRVDLREPSVDRASEVFDKAVSDQIHVALNEKMEEDSMPCAASHNVGDTSSGDSDLTEIDDAITHDPVESVPESQLITTDTHLIDPAAPRVSYEVSTDDIFTTEREIQPHDRVPLLQSPPLKTTAAYERYMRPDSVKFNLTLSVERTMGPKRPIAANILEILETWHETHPESTEHPCTVTKRQPATWENFMVFDEDAGQYELSLFLITSKRKYRKNGSYMIMVLHTECGPDELVIFNNSRPKTGTVTKGVHGMYLFAWIEEQGNFAAKARAMKVWRSDNQKISFNSRWFDYRDPCSDLSTSPVKPSALGVLEDVKREHDTEPTGALSNMSLSVDHLRGPSNQLPLTVPGLTNTHGRRDDSLGSPFSPNGNEVSRIGCSSSFRDRVNAVVHAYDQSQRRRYLVRVKLGSNDDGPFRYFDTENAFDFFQKIREFFKPAPVGVLCTYPGLEGVRFIGDDCNDELDIFLDDIRRSSCPDGEELVVSVCPAADGSKQ